MGPLPPLNAVSSLRGGSSESVKRSCPAALCAAGPGTGVGGDMAWLGSWRLARQALLQHAPVGSHSSPPGKPWVKGRQW